MEFVDTSMNELCITSDQNRRIWRRAGRKRFDNDDTTGYKSKNLVAERKRRQKLSDRLLALRSLMNKATIIEDAITYIKELQNNVDILTDQLLQMEAAAAAEEAQSSKIMETGTSEEMQESVIQSEVNVTQIHGNKLLTEIILEKKRGRFSKLVEAMNDFGIEFVDTNVTSAKGAFLISTSIQGLHGETLSVQKTKDLLQGIINVI